MPALIDHTGKAYGNWQVVARAGRDKSHGAKWLCRCVCGVERIVSAHSFVRGKSRGCGCAWHSKTASSRRGAVRRHGESALAAISQRYSINVAAAKQKKLEFTISWPEFQELVLQPCYYCGSEPSATYSIKRLGVRARCNGLDRFDNSKGYVAGNCVPCCTRCNFVKLAMDGDEFIDFCLMVADYRREVEGRLEAEVG